MIRWREEKDCYRVTIVHSGQVGCAASVGVATTLVGLSGVLVGFHPGSLLCGLSFITLGASLIWAGERATRHDAWVEIAVRGGRARWGGSPSEPVEELVEVSFFQQQVSSNESTRVEARLRDGRTLRVFGPAPWFTSQGANKLVDQMNEYLCADVGPPPPMGGTG